MHAIVAHGHTPFLVVIPHVHGVDALAPSTTSFLFFRNHDGSNLRCLARRSKVHGSAAESLAAKLADARTTLMIVRAQRPSGSQLGKAAVDDAESARRSTSLNGEQQYTSRPLRHRRPSRRAQPVAADPYGVRAPNRPAPHLRAHRRRARGVRNGRARLRRRRRQGLERHGAAQRGGVRAVQRK